MGRSVTRTSSIWITMLLGTIALYTSPVSNTFAAAPAVSDIQIGEIQGIIERHHDVFGGLVGDRKTHVVKVFLAESSNAAALTASLAEVDAIVTTADPMLSMEPKPWTLEFSTRGPSLADLDSIMFKVANAEPWHTDIGSHVVSYGPDPIQQAVVIELDTITEDIQAEASSTFGNLAVLELGTRTGMMYDRWHDGLPYWGATALWSAVSDHVPLDS